MEKQEFMKFIEDQFPELIEEEEVNFMVEKLKVLHELKMAGRPFIPDRNNYFIVCEVETRHLAIDWSVRFKSLYIDCYFDNEEDVLKAIDKIGEDRIKTYLFGINK